MTCRSCRIAGWTAAILLAWMTPLLAQVSFDRILGADRTPEEWLTYNGTLSAQRHSALTQITPANVKTLELQWVFQARSLEKFEASPLVAGGVLYTVQAPNDVVALDAATGRVYWVYTHTPSPLARLCCGRVNRGLAMLDQTLFMATIDGRLIALDAKNGAALWNVAVGGARAEAGYSFTVAPLVVKDKVIIGTAGGEYGVRGFLAAFDAKTGREAWRFHTVPGPGEPGNESWSGESWKTGGGSVWVTGSYDRELNLTYWGIGNPGPDWNGDQRLGDNLYSDSVVALDADTGRLKWHFQFTPHDVYDYDSVQVPVLADIDWQGRARKVMLFANRNGFFYVLDRATGEYLLGRPFAKVTWTSGLDAKGRPQNMVPLSEAGSVIYPGVQGATNWYSPSFSPRTGLFYVPVWAETFSTFIKRPVEYREGQRFTGALPGMPIRLLIPGPVVNRRRPEDGHGAIQAIDPKTGAKAWEFTMTDVIDAGVLSTASDLVFSGNREGYVFALDAKNGTLLWRANVGGQASNSPITYAMNGRQYVAFAAGSSLFVYALPQPAAQAAAGAPQPVEARLRAFEDRDEIERLLLDYGRHLDARDFGAYAALFATDGEWVGGFGKVAGPANIKTFMEKAMPGQNTARNYHLLSNFVISVQGDTATAWSRWAFVVPGQQGAAIAQAGRYDDTLVRENGRWRFKRRVASNDTAPPPPPR